MPQLRGVSVGILQALNCIAVFNVLRNFKSILSSNYLPKSAVYCCVFRKTVVTDALTSLSAAFLLAAGDEACKSTLLAFRIFFSFIFYFIYFLFFIFLNLL